MNQLAEALYSSDANRSVSEHAVQPTETVLAETCGD
jgi:hypothetical protein